MSVETQEWDFIQLARKGDLEAYGELTRLHVDSLLCFLSLHCPIPHLVEQVASFTFVQAFRQLKDYDDNLPFQDWVRKLAWNLLRTTVMNYKREEFRTLDDIGKTLLHGTEIFIESRRSSPDQLEESLARVEGMLREVLDLKYVEECSNREIANRFQVSETWVETTLYRLRQQLGLDIHTTPDHGKD